MERDFDITGPIKKITTSTIIIMPPRVLWNTIQEIRTKNDFELRTGPHITVVYPFIHEKLFGDAVQLLSPVLGQIKPFTVTLEEFGIFDNDTTATLYLKPVTAPAGALHQLQKAIAKVFPHCTDVDLIADTGFTPHMSIGGYNGNNAAILAKACADQHAMTFKNNPIQFLVTEVYVCARTGSDPFEVKFVISLDSAKIDIHSRPYFGPKSPQIPNILYVGNLPRTDDITELFLKGIFPTASNVKLTTQPDGVTSRGCAWVEFNSPQEAHHMLGVMTRKPYKIGNNVQIVVKLASLMSYP